MHQSTTPSLSQTIWARLASRQFLNLSIVQTLLPVTFGYSLSSEASLWDNWGDERGCDRGHWHAHTRGLPWGLAEMLERWNKCIAAGGDNFKGDKSFMCVLINKNAHTKSMETYLMIHVNIVSKPAKRRLLVISPTNRERKDKN